MTIASALDLLNDKLAGSDQEAAQTIEGAIMRIIDNIDNIGGGSSGGGGLVVHDVEGTLDKTYAEIAAAAQVGAVILSQPYYDDPSATMCVILSIYGQMEDVGYVVTFDSYTYAAETEDGYPVAAD